MQIEELKACRTCGSHITNPHSNRYEECCDIEEVADIRMVVELLLNEVADLKKQVETFHSMGEADALAEVARESFRSLNL